MNTIQTKSAGGIVINKKREVLIVSQKGTSWSLPKGHIENKETPLEAAIREIREESGITSLKFIKDLGHYKRYKMSKTGGNDKSEMKTIYLFLFSTNQTTLKPIDPENPEAKWVDKKEVVKLLSHKKDKDFFLKFIDE